MRIPRPNTTQPLPPDERRKAVESIRWKWFEMNDYFPHSAQRDLHLSRARYRMAIAGTRGGKSRYAGEEATVYLLAGNTRVWLVGQTYNTTEKEFRYIYDRLTSPLAQELFGADYLQKCVYNDKGGDMQIRTNWGSEVKCISLENATTSAFGDEVDLLVLCEPAQIKFPKRQFDRILRGRIANRLGDLLLPGTPAGKAPAHDPDGWVCDMYEKGLGDDSDYYTRQWPSWENPEFNDDPYTIRREINPKIFAEQYEGKFVIFSGAIFESFNPEVHVIKEFKPPRNWNRYEAIDPGYSGEFYWLASVTGYNNDLYICDEMWGKKTRWIEHANNIWERRMLTYDLPFSSFTDERKNFNKTLYKTAQGKHKVPKTTTRIDPEDPACIADFNAYGITAFPADNNVHVGIDRVENRLRLPKPRLFITENCTHLIEALINHSWAEKKYGDDGTVEIRMPAKDKYKHACDTLRYVCMDNLIASQDFKEEPEFSEPDLYDLMVNANVGGKHPFDLSYDERRRAI